MQRRARGASRRTVALFALSALLVVSISACGQTQTSATGGPGPAATSTWHASTIVFPTATPSTMPYSFASAWHAPISGTSHIFTFVFAASAPAIGYACEVDDKSNVSSGPPLLVTKDGGATWGAPAAYPMGNAACQVFADPGDASDVFLASSLGSSSTPSLWRSRDGGATWKQLATITVKQAPASVLDLTVIGSRVVARIAPAGTVSTAFLDDLVASDDDGATWRQIGESMKPNGQIGLFVLAGSTLFAEVHPACLPCSYVDAAQRLPARSPSTRPWLSAPASSFVANSYYRSTDAGATWTKIGSLPANTNVLGLRFAPSQVHQGQYVGVAIADSLGETGISTSLYYTVDTGQTWRQVPSFDGVGGGWPDPGTLGGNGQLAVLPDQALFAGTIHNGIGPNGAQPSEAGIFRLGLEASGQWLPFAPNSVSGADGSTGFIGQWQVVANGSGWRIWGVANGYGASTGLVYLDVS